MTWGSLHVYYYAPQDPLIVDGLWPTVTRLREQGLVQQSFFLRYWAGGPHVRLRMQAGAAAQTAKALVGAQAGIAEYLRRHPSDATIDPSEYRGMQQFLGDLEGVAGDGGLIDDNSAHRAAYEPEYGKYGGARGVEIAERLFDHSSRIAVGVLALAGGNQPRRLGIALSMMLSALRAIGFDREAMAGFLDRHYRYWARYTTGQTEIRWADSTGRAIPGNPEPTGGTVTPLDREQTRALLADWSAAVAEAWSALGQHAAEVLPAVTMIGEGAPAEVRKNGVLMSYLHTHNNRLGVRPIQEAYLAFRGREIVSRAGSRAASV
jgi:thiopeptide-type bacteriocin biosynthesis protein